MFHSVNCRPKSEIETKWINNEKLSANVPTVNHTFGGEDHGPMYAYRKISNWSRISNRSRPPNFEKKSFFLQKVSTLKTSNWSCMATFQICQEPILFSYHIKRTMTRPLATLTALIENTLYKPRWFLTLYRHEALYSHTMCDNRAGNVTLQAL